MMTMKTLSKMGVRHNVIVEPSQVREYQEAVSKLGTLSTIIPLDMSYKAKYELCDEHGLSKSTGSGPARNFAWDHAAAHGADFHWTIDDNISAFYRLNAGKKHKVASSAFFVAMEDFVARYANVGMAGPEYEMFVPRRMRFKPFRINCRVFSCNLIRTKLPHRWRGRYNEDAILTLDLLKSGWCTTVFLAFLQKKIATQRMPGGNTTELYGVGTEAKSRMLYREHPDVVELVMRYGRHHHRIDFRAFADKPSLRRIVPLPSESNEYGMALRRVRR
jgi:hypothetical protein